MNIATDMKKDTSNATDADIQALRADLRNLRNDFTKVGETLRDLAAHGTAEAGDKIKNSADKVWVKAKNQANNVAEEIEAHPMQAALIAFGVGTMLGMLFRGRRS
jgi:ElaB/YqjD/DUF883 family membrane-anchored ribosome-binding protein